MKSIYSLLLTVGMSSVLMSSTPANSQPQQMVQFSNSNPSQTNVTSAIQVIAPQKSLESAVRNAAQGDILLMGSEGWYRIEGRTLENGTKMYILGSHGSVVAAFPKEESNSAIR